MSFVLKSVATLISSLKRSAKEVDRHGYLLLRNNNNITIAIRKKCRVAFPTLNSSKKRTGIQCC